jgi:TolB-like protein/class 3 adenylate cyclase/Tfp pilus assembly protein PilF
LTREHRRLAAVVAADVVGYSRLMSRDEAGTLARLKANRQERLEPALARNGGRLVKLTGDGALVEFSSAVDALRAAIEVQQAISDANSDQPEDERIVFRIGIHLGDLIVDDDDLYGDGVNVAARLEAEAPAGGIIVSRAIREAVDGRLKAKLHALGDLALKNIERPVRAFRVEWEAADWRSVSTVPINSTKTVPAAAPSPRAALDKPSIAVLPFQNMSGDPEQEYFADGMVEDIITGLSRIKSLFVIARNSSFAYKGKSPDIRQVGRELGVRYVLEGSVRKAGSRVRITGQLIDTSSGAHIWADRFDGELADIFDMQDQVTARVIGAIGPTLELVEIERAKRKTGNLEAYDYYLRSWAALYRYSRESTDEAMTLLRKAVELDPEFALAHATMATCYLSRRVFEWVVDPGAEAAEAERAARRALELDRSDARVLTYSGYTLVLLTGRGDEGLAHLDQATEADPNSAQAWAWRGVAKNVLGDPEGAIPDLECALRLSPLDPLNWIPLSAIAFAHFYCGRYEEASSWAAQTLRQRPNYANGLRIAMAAHALAGRIDLAREAWASYLQLYPTARISTMKGRFRLANGKDSDKFLEGFRLAGMPE